MTEDLINKIEALLFASGKFMSDEKLSEVLGTELREVRKALKKLQEIYAQGTNSLIIDQDNNNWKFNVKQEYLGLVSKIVDDTELSKTVIETLAIIAWKSPSLQSDVIKIRSNKAYEHIDQLEKMGFVTREKYGRSFRLRVTQKFFDHFDVKGDKSLKELFKDVKVPKKDEQATLTATESAVSEEKEAEEEITEKESEKPEEPTTSPVIIPDQPIEAIKESIEKDQKEVQKLEQGIISKEKEESKKEKVFESAKQVIQKEEKTEKVPEKIEKKKEEKKRIMPVKKQDIIKNKPLPRKIAQPPKAQAKPKMKAKPKPVPKKAKPTPKPSPKTKAKKKR